MRNVMTDSIEKITADEADYTVEINFNCGIATLAVWDDEDNLVGSADINEHRETVTVTYGICASGETEYNYYDYLRNKAVSGLGEAAVAIGNWIIDTEQG